MNVYESNIKVGEKFLWWHSSGFWGNPTVEYIGPNYVVDKHGVEYKFADIRKGECDYYDSLSYVWDSVAKKVFMVNKRVIKNSSKEAKELQKLKKSLGLIGTRKKKKKTEEDCVTYSSMEVSEKEDVSKCNNKNRLSDYRVKSFDDAIKDLKSKKCGEMSLLDTGGQLFLTFHDGCNEYDKPVAYAMGSGVEETVRIRCLSDKSTLIYAYKMATDKKFQITEVVRSIKGRKDR